MPVLQRRDGGEMNRIDKYSIITYGGKLPPYANEEKEEKCHSGREDAPQDVSQVKSSEGKQSQVQPRTICVCRGV